jgi:Zn-dependent M28 family amino/carboxypeptidase
MLRARRGRTLAAGWRALGLLVVAPFAAMAWFHVAGPSLRAPSPGAIDNGGSVVALLQLAERVGARPDGAATTVELVFTAAEEERALGSRAHASTLPRDAALAVVNLESIGADGPLGVATRDGFALRRYETPLAFVHWLGAVAQRESGRPLAPAPLPFGTLTDARSYLAQGIPALTLRPTFGGAFPSDLHSDHDQTERLANPAIERAVDLLDALVRSADADPAAFATAARR